MNTKRSSKGAKDSAPKKSLASLSKNLMQMKFMQRSRKEYEKQVEEKADSQIIDFESIKNQHGVKRSFIMEPSAFICERLNFGRLSFRGMNPEVEKLMESHSFDGTLAPTKRQAPSSDDELSDEVDITAKEMARRKFDRTKRPVKHSQQPTPKRAKTFFKREAKH